MWVTDYSTSPGKLLKLDSNGAIVQMVTVGSGPGLAVFDGTNIWVPNRNSNNVMVVRASTGSVLATLTVSSPGFVGPGVAAFDGERILVVHANGVSLWNASDLSPLGSLLVGVGPHPGSACSDGLNFWITIGTGGGVGYLARF